MLESLSLEGAPLQFRMVRSRSGRICSPLLAAGSQAAPLLNPRFFPAPIVAAFGQVSAKP